MAGSSVAKAVVDSPWRRLTIPCGPERRQRIGPGNGRSRGRAWEQRDEVVQAVDGGDPGSGGGLLRWRRKPEHARGGGHPESRGGGDAHAGSDAGTHARWRASGRERDRTRPHHVAALRRREPGRIRLSVPRERRRPAHYSRRLPLPARHHRQGQEEQGDQGQRERHLALGRQPDRRREHEQHLPSDAEGRGTGGSAPQPSWTVSVQRALHGAPPTS